MKTSPQISDYSYGPSYYVVSNSVYRIAAGEPCQIVLVQFYTAVVWSPGFVYYCQALSSTSFCFYSLFQECEIMKLVLLLTQLLLFCQLSLQNLISIGEKSALLIIDVQNCFLEGGSLAVPDGNQVIPVINNLRKKFKNVVLTQDWHCVNHVSFASVHPG